MVKVAEEMATKLQNNDSIVNVIAHEDPTPKHNPDQLTDDVVYNRLPKNFFVKDVEE